MTNVEQIEAWHAHWLQTGEAPASVQQIGWGAAEALAHELDEAMPAIACKGGPLDHFCTQLAGHAGDCHLVPLAEIEEGLA